MHIGLMRRSESNELPRPRVKPDTAAMPQSTYTSNNGTGPTLGQSPDGSWPARKELGHGTGLVTSRRIAGLARSERRRKVPRALTRVCTCMNPQAVRENWAQ